VTGIILLDSSRPRFHLDAFLSRLRSYGWMRRTWTADPPGILDCSRISVLTLFEAVRRSPARCGTTLPPQPPTHHASRRRRPRHVFRLPGGSQPMGNHHRGQRASTSRAPSRKLAPRGLASLATGSRILPGPRGSRSTEHRGQGGRRGLFLLRSTEG
jgi:hypothetical protein